ncbi:MAG: hypothetical protein RBT65_08410 [Methanolobus sp.]|jgi:hypothetical protein|nr:hypothetical protein [Methanolobus sp.]
MNRDFTLIKYESLLKAIIKTNYTTTTVNDYIAFEPQNCIIMRHDVDRAINRSFAMAKLEYDYGIKSTYYFRYRNDTFKPDIIRKILDMGHEVGYHYEVIDKAKHDFEKAIEIFKKELDEFRLITNINTICMHGNPLSPFSNLEIWDKYSFENFGILGEPYISIDYNKVIYFTDTGRTWSDPKILNKYFIDNKDFIDRSGINGKYKPRSIFKTDDIIQLIESEMFPQICLLTHPNRWCDEYLSWTKELVFQRIKNIGKAGLILYRSLNNDKNVLPQIES